MISHKIDNTYITLPVKDYEQLVADRDKYAEELGQLQRESGILIKTETEYRYRLDTYLPPRKPMRYRYLGQDKVIQDLVEQNEILAEEVERYREKEHERLNKKPQVLSICEPAKVPTCTRECPFRKS